MIDFLRDITKYMMARKKYWLLPVIFALLVLGMLIVIGGASPIAPFIYSLF